MLSHPHEDHAGGLPDILDSFRPDAIYVPAGWFDVEEIAPSIVEGFDKARAMGIPIRQLHTGDIVELSGAARLEVYSPDAGTVPEEVNDMSMLALVSCEGQKALFTGDLSQAGEPDVIPDADVLKVAHHGSARSSSEAFLRAVAPRVALLSGGDPDRAEAFAARLPETADLYATARQGMLTLRFGAAGQYSVETFLPPHKEE